MIQSGEPAEFPTGFKEVGSAACLATEGGGGPSPLLLGPPGAGKSMLARRLTTILPAMTLADIYDLYPPASMSKFAHRRVAPHTCSSSGMASDDPHKAGCYAPLWLTLTIRLRPTCLSLIDVSLERPRFHRSAVARPHSCAVTCDAVGRTLERGTFCRETAGRRRLPSS
jgi:hypothetical protein